MWNDLLRPWRDTPRRSPRRPRARVRRQSLAGEPVEERVLLSFAVGLNVPGTSLSPDVINNNGGFGFIPPDTMGAIGPNHFVELTNGSFSVYNKTTGALITRTGLTQFWINAGITGLNTNPSIGPGAGDDRVLWDPDSGRWFAASFDNSSSNNRVLLAVSATSDPTGTWKGVATTMNDPGLFSDFPTLGLDHDGVFVCTTDFIPNGAAQFVSVLTVPKADLLLATPTLANDHIFTTSPGFSAGFTIQPVVNPTGSLPEVLVSSDRITGNLIFSTVTGTITSPTLNKAVLTTAVAGNSNTIAARQSGGPNTIESGDNRFSGNVIQQGSFIWGAVTNTQTTAGTAHEVVKWFRFNASTFAIAESGLIGDTDTAHDYIYPSISVNPTGDVVIGYTQSGSGQFASTGFSVGKFNGTTTTFSAPTSTKAGTGSYNITFGSGRNRWGDYTATTLDPNDPGTFWTVQEWASPDMPFGSSNPGNWHEQLTQVGIAPSVTGVTSTTANGTYGTGNVINVTVNFDLPVSVTGTPQIALNTVPGGVATYVSGSGTNALTFQYTVVSGQYSAHLDYTSSTALTGGSITNKSVTAAAANLTLPAPGSAGSLGANTNIQIVTTLEVVQFTPNPSGFSVRFSQPINTSVLHLYTSNLPQFSNTTGPPCVTLVGATTGAITGSLVLDADGQGFTFVKTGAPLAADTYTVVLRSDAGNNGIQTPGGSPLDGNNSGIPGTNYTNMFTAAPAAVTLSVPDFARGPSQPVNVPASATGLPVQISNSTGVKSATFTVTFNPADLTVTGATPDPDIPGSVVSFILMAGSIQVTVTAPAALPAGIANLADLTASVPMSAQSAYLTKEVLAFGPISLTDGSGNPISATGGDAVHVVGYLADASGDGFINAFDNSLIQRVILGLDTGFGAYKDLDPRIVADINGDGFINAFDNSLVQRFILGQNPPQIPALPPGVTTTNGVDPLVYIPKGLTVSPGGSVSVPVNFLQTAGAVIDLGSFDLAIGYDPAAFAVAGVRPGGLAAGDSLLWWADPSRGLIYVSAARQAGPTALNPGDSGSLAVLDLVALPGATPGARSLNLLDSVYAGGEGRASRLEDGHLVLGPAPTNGANDPVDGSVVVVGRKTPTLTGIAPVAAPGVVDAAIQSVWPGPLTAPATVAGTSVRPARSIPLQVGVTTPRAVVVQTNAARARVVFDAVRNGPTH
jgi:hypothetical protein